MKLWKIFSLVLSLPLSFFFFSYMQCRGHCQWRCSIFKNCLHRWTLGLPKLGHHAHKYHSHLQHLHVWCQQERKKTWKTWKIIKPFRIREVDMWIKDMILSLSSDEQDEHENWPAEIIIEQKALISNWMLDVGCHFRNADGHWLMMIC